MSFFRRRERAAFRPLDPVHAGPREVLAFLSEIFVSLAECPRKLRVEIDLRAADLSEPLVLDLVRGEVVVGMAGDTARSRFAGRWLADHDVPLALDRRRVFRFTPIDAGRIRVEV